jgi:hypothetical protein
MSNPQAIVDLTHEVKRLATSKISDINDINRETTFLALNALIEAARAGNAGKGFAVVANQVKHVSRRISEMTTDLNKNLAGSLHAHPARRQHDRTAALSRRPALRRSRAQHD